MQYHAFQDLKLAALGLGCMRLPVVEGKNDQIDMEAAGKMVAHAIEKGINYFDTAWGYHEGNSEIAMGELLKAYPRESYYLATKFPGYDLSNLSDPGKVQEIFERQLEKCGVEYFDFYLLHNVCEKNVDRYLDPALGMLDYLLEQKKNGRIRHLGFSTHSALATMERFLDACGEYMEFCQIQLNWLDWTFESGKTKVELLHSRNIPIIVMEPVRGGKLITLSEAHTAQLQALQPHRTNAAWAFRFLQSIPGVIVTLSGMSNMAQLQENIEIFSSLQPLAAHETDALLEIAAEMTAEMKLPCTECRYCTGHCPQSLDIPALLAHYNAIVCTDDGASAISEIKKLPEEKHPSACIGCGSCEAVCPQNIQISKFLSELGEKIK